MTEIAKLAPEYSSLEPSYSGEDIRESVSLMISALKRVGGNKDVAYVLKENHDEHLYISHELLRLLCKILGHIEEGGEVNLAPNTRLFTTHEAADILNVPMEYLKQLISEGIISVKDNKDNQLIEAGSLFAFKRSRDKESDEAFKQLINLTRDFY